MDHLWNKYHLWNLNNIQLQGNWTCHNLLYYISVRSKIVHIVNARQSIFTKYRRYRYSFKMTDLLKIAVIVTLKRTVRDCLIFQNYLVSKLCGNKMMSDAYHHISVSPWNNDVRENRCIVVSLWQRPFSQSLLTKKFWRFVAVVTFGDNTYWFYNTLLSWNKSKKKCFCKLTVCSSENSIY